MTITAPMGGSSTTQRTTASATSNASGVATFTFPHITCPLGSIVRGVVSVTNAPPAASSNVVTSGGVSLPPFLGANPFGPFDLFEFEALTVTSTGLKATTKYVCMFVYQEIPKDQAGTSLPIPYTSSTVNAQGIAGGVHLAVSGGLDRIQDINGPHAPLTATTASQNTLLTAIGVDGHGALDNYTVIELVAQSNVAFTLALQISANEQSQWQTAKFFAGDTHRFFFPMGIVPGDTIGVNYIALSGSNAFNLGAYGHSWRDIGGLLRPDERRKPTGSNAALQTATVANPNLIAAPPAGWCILLKHWGISGGAAPPTNGSVNVTIGGTTIQSVLINQPASGDAVSPGPLIDENGLLCDPATAVVLSVATGTCGAYATYDVVK